MRDIDVRRELLAEMNRIHSHDVDTIVVQELGLCQGIARIDIAVVNGKLHGYEIKSEKDTLARLPAQLDVYNRTLEFVTIVTALNHAENVQQIVPWWWGIVMATSCEDRVKLEGFRTAARNPTIVPSALAQLLWRDEALRALEIRGLASGLRSKPREHLWNCLAAELELSDLADLVRQSLKSRMPTWRVPALQA